MTSTKEEIIEILCALYQIPGEYFIVGIISLGIGKSMLEFTNYGLILVILGVILLILEAVAPLIAGVRLYEKAINNIGRLFK